MGLRKRIAAGTLLLGGVGCALAACNARWDNDVDPGDYGGGYYGSTETTDDAGVIIKGDGSPSAAPMLAKLDPGASMVQTPGQGVGVFTQYDAGGHWYVWWTCDTNTSGQSCDFATNVSVDHGEITNATTQNFQTTDSLQVGGADGGVDASASTSIASETVTTGQVQGVHFDTDPGAVITLSAALGGEYSGAFLFFVEDAKVNGGYKGTVSDPLDLQASSP